MTIRPLAAEPAVIERLAEILRATVAAGGSVHFLHPVTIDEATAYWREAFADRGRIVLGGFASPGSRSNAECCGVEIASPGSAGARSNAERCGVEINGEALVGTVTLSLAVPPNQPFRGEIWKLMTDPAARGRGVARALMLAAEQLALEHGRTLLTLDTVAGGAAAKLYESLGWIQVGVIPDFAFDPHGTLVTDAIYYKHLSR